jgi:hypothetical protein
MRTLLAPVAFLLASAPALADASPTVQQCLAASNASVKLRASHELRRARAELLVCVAASCPAEVREECGKRIDRVTESLPTVVFEAKDGAGHDLTNVKVTMDGAEVVTARVDGSAVTLDPGPHTFTFETPGEQPKTLELVLHEGDKNVHAAAVLGAVPAPTLAPPTTPGTAQGRRTAGIALGVVGLAGVAAGAIYGSLTLSKWSTAKGECSTGTQCSQKAIDDRSTAVTYSTVSDVGLIAGGVLAATGIILYVTAPSAAATAGLRVTPAGLAGTF